MPESPVNDHSFDKILELLGKLQEKVKNSATSLEDDEERMALLSDIKKIFPPDPLSLECPEFLIEKKLLSDTDAIASAITEVKGKKTALENAIKDCYPHYLDRASSMIFEERWEAWALKEPKKMVILAARLREIEKEKVGLATEEKSQCQLSRIFHPLSNLLLELLPRVGGLVVILLVIPFVPSIFLAVLIFEAPVIGSILWYLAFLGLILASPTLAALTGLSAVTITTIGLIVLILPLVFLGLSVLGAESRRNSDIPTSSGKKTDDQPILNPAPVSSSALATASEKTPRSSNLSRFCSFMAKCLQVREKQDETEKDLSPRSSTSGKKSE